MTHFAVTKPVSTDVSVLNPRRKCHDPPPTRDLPELNGTFIGRELNMTFLEGVLLSGAINVLGINGPPGFGKSTLAIYLGQEMAKNCYTVGYVDMEKHHEILSYVVTAFNERRLVAWQPPRELTFDSSKEETSFLAKNGLEWFEGEALLIIDNCNYVLSDKQHRKNFFAFLEAMIRGNGKGKILLTSDEEINLDSNFYRHMNFALGNLSVEASVELLKTYSSEISDHDAEELATAVEFCPIALRLVGSLLKVDEPSELIRALSDRKSALRVLNETDPEHAYLNFISVMDVASGFLARKELASAMYFSFFPRHFHIEAASKIIMQSDKKYNIYAEILTNKIAEKTIKNLKRKSLLEKLSVEKIVRYKMHRLIKMYFMDRGERYDSGIEANFNSSFRIYFSDLGVRRKPKNEIRARVQTELLSEHDKYNFNYLIEMLLSNFGSHIYSEDELIYLAFAFHKGLIHFDYYRFRTLLKLFTYRRPQVAILPNQDLTVEDIPSIASDFENFFTDVLCKVTSHDICINIYLDILYKLYEAEKCGETFEDNLEDSCRMIHCDYAHDYFKILKKLDAFNKCSYTRFCSLLLNVNHLCSTFALLISPLKYMLLVFFSMLCCGLIVMIITCLRIRSVPIFLCRHTGHLVVVYLLCVIPTYTLTVRKYIGIHFDAPLEIHARNVVCSVAMILYIVFVFFRMLRHFYNI